MRALPLRAMGGRAAVRAVPWLWLLLFFAVPFVIVLKISFAARTPTQPPYSALLEWGEGAFPRIVLHTDSYLGMLQDSIYLHALLNSLEVAAISTLLCLLIAYPMAYGIARTPRSWRNLLLMLVVLPFWTSFLLRVYAWMGLLRGNGLVNQVLLALHVVDEPLVMLQTNFAMYLGIVYSYLPFMILPLYSNLEKHDPALLEAAADLGCRPFRAFLSVTLPLSWRSIAAGCILVFIPAVGEFVIPRLLGGLDSLMIGRVLWDEFFSSGHWPNASAVAVCLLLILVPAIVLFQRFQEDRGEAG